MRARVRARVRVRASEKVRVRARARVRATDKVWARVRVTPAVDSRHARRHSSPTACHTCYPLGERLGEHSQ